MKDKQLLIGKLDHELSNTHSQFKSLYRSSFIFSLLKLIIYVFYQDENPLESDLRFLLSISSLFNECKDSVMQKYVCMHIEVGTGIVENQKVSFHQMPQRNPLLVLELREKY